MRGEAEAREHARQTGHQNFQVGGGRSEQKCGGAWLMSNHCSAAESATAACAPVRIDGQIQCDVCRSTADDAASGFWIIRRRCGLFVLYRTAPASELAHCTAGLVRVPRTAEGCSRRSLVNCTQRRRRVRNSPWLHQYISRLSANVRNIAHVPRPRRHIVSIATCLIRIVRRQGSL